MRTACLFALLLACPALARAQAPMAPPYQRVRTGAEQWHARGGHNQHWRGGANQAWGGGFVNPLFFTPPIVAGSWYERPYPYHFDYYRQRWGGAPQAPYGDPNVEMIPAADCPCLTPQAASP